MIKSRRRAAASPLPTAPMRFSAGAAGRTVPRSAARWRNSTPSARISNCSRIAPACCAKRSRREWGKRPTATSTSSRSSPRSSCRSPSSPSCFQMNVHGTPFAADPNGFWTRSDGRYDHPRAAPAILLIRSAPHPHEHRERHDAAGRERRGDAVAHQECSRRRARAHHHDRRGPRLPLRIGSAGQP